MERARVLGQVSVGDHARDVLRRIDDAGLAEATDQTGQLINRRRRQLQVYSAGCVNEALGVDEENLAGC